MSTTLDVMITPADFTALKGRPMNGATCVVFDVFRATSTMITALANGAEAVIPVEDISDALALRGVQPDLLLAGEREGRRIQGTLSGGVEFDFGNSPREFTRGRIAGRTIVSTTTNGTRALRACADAATVLLGAFLNLKATADFIRSQAPRELLLVCSGTGDQAAYEDVLGAGALCDALWETRDETSDAAVIARRIYQAARTDLERAASGSKNGRRLSAIPELRDDVTFCLQRDVFDFAAGLRKGEKAGFQFSILDR